MPTTYRTRVPEPATLALLGLGLAGIGAARRKRLVGQDSPTEPPTEADAEPSVGNVGESCDNALAEAIIGLYSTDVIYSRGA